MCVCLFTCFTLYKTKRLFLPICTKFSAVTFPWRLKITQLFYFRLVVHSKSFEGLPGQRQLSLLVCNNLDIRKEMYVNGIYSVLNRNLSVVKNNINYTYSVLQTTLVIVLLLTVCRNETNKYCIKTLSKKIV